MTSRFLLLSLSLCALTEARADCAEPSLLWRIPSGAHFALIDKSGKVRVDRVDEVLDPSQNRRAARVDKKWGVLNETTGQWVAIPRFSWVGAFAQGLCAASENGKVGFLGLDGRWKIAPRFALPKVDADATLDDSAYFSSPLRYIRFSQGLCPVQSNSKWGFINAAGKFVIPPRFTDAKPFSEGFAVVTLPGKPFKDSKDMTEKDIDDILSDDPQVNPHEAWVRRDGSLLHPPKKSGNAMLDDFSEGLAAVDTDIGHSKIGFVNTKGQFIIAPRFGVAHLAACSTGAFEGGVALVQMNDIVADNAEMGIIDKNGKWVIAPIKFGKNDNARWGDDGRIAWPDARGKWGFRNRTGKWAIAPQFQEAYSFVGGVACARSGGKYGFLRPDGSWLLAPKFDVLPAKQEWTGGIPPYFDGELALVTQGEEMGYINRSGAWVWRAAPASAPVASR